MSEKEAAEADFDFQPAQPPREDRKPGVRWTQELHDYIVGELQTGRSLSSILREPNMPTRQAFYAWVRDDTHPMSVDYPNARALGMETIGDELIELADQADAENFQAMKLRLETRKWVLEKILPQTYGKRKEVNHTGSIEHTQKLPSDRELARILGAIAYETGQPLLEAETVEINDSRRIGAASDGEMQDRAQTEDASKKS